jgi:hypothetical protein
LLASIWELGWWAIMTPRILLVAGLAVVIGGPPGFIYWRATRNRAGAIATGLVVAVAGLLVLAWIYYTRVLCPPGAMCA